MLDLRLEQRLGAAPAPAVDIAVRRTRLGAVRASDLLTIARRDNPKRAVLFVSRVLGKHLPVDPALALLAGAALGEAVAETLDDRPAPAPRPTLVTDTFVAALLGSATPCVPSPGSISTPAIVIGYAETATALGHIVRRQLGPGPTGHTTRALLDDSPLLTFTEPHSHAVEHLLYHHDPAFLANDLPVVLVDDELTSGQTACNTIEAIQQQWPRPRYIVASLVDWRSADAQATFAVTAARLGTRIDAVSLLAGDVVVHDAPPLPSAGAAAPSGEAGLAHGATPARAVHTTELTVGPPTARAGWTLSQQDEITERARQAGRQLAELRHGPAALVLGTEELMFTPMLLAAAMGSGVSYRSTTRSPIVPARAVGYPISSRSAFPGSDGDGERFLYNNEALRYDDVFVCFEGQVPGDDHPLFATVSQCGRNVHAVVLR